jgi:hypothetical protein
VIAAQPAAFATAVAPVDANSTSKKASTLPREADSAPGGGGSTLSVGQRSTSAEANTRATSRV